MRRSRVAIVAALGLALAGNAAAVELAISCGAVGQELEVCQNGVALWAAKTGNTVEVVSTPNSATERLALYQQLLAAESDDIDVLQIDVIWPGILAQHFVDLKPVVGEAALAAYFPRLIENDTVGGKLVALPWFTDAGLLYYRKDLLEKHGLAAPTSWTELAATAKLIQDAERAAGNDRLWGYVFQGKAYEGLTCNALEWIASFGGGTIVAADGKITVDNPQAVAAIDWAASTIKTIAPEGVLNYAEEEARGVFQSGNAVFMRNWPYAWALVEASSSEIRGKVGVAALPGAGPGTTGAGALGGWQLAVSRYSAHPKEAADLVRFLAGPEEQKRRAITGAYNPTLPALYQDAEILAAVPFFASLSQTFTNAVPRPSTVTGTRYNQVSAEVFGAVHAALGGGTPAKEAMANLQRKLDRLSRGGRW